MRRIALTLTLFVAGAATLAASAGADDVHTYKIEMYNAFGIVEGSQVRVAGVNAGVVKDLEINEKKRALVTVELTGELGTLGEDTQCSSEPQSLIAEYFIDCEPAGQPLPENGTVPAEQVSQTVQADLVQNTLREPFKRRLQLLINEFGTALAGNPESLNEAIRLGAPALTQFREVSKILAEQNAIIRDLNVNSERVIGELADRRDDVVRFVREARDTAEISVSRREDLSRNFEILDDFLAELEPTLADLETLARAQTPMLTDLRAAAPGLNRLALNLPPFNRASEDSLRTLGEAGVVGRRALRRGRDEIRLLAEAGKKAPLTAKILADFVRDLDDPRRAVEIDDRAERDTGRTSTQPGTKNTMGYTGLEGLLNYAYYQPAALNQFDKIGHLLHFSLYEVNSGLCGHFDSGRDPATGEPGVPAQEGGTTTDILELADCAAWLGPNQPGVNDFIELPKFNPAVCPNGTEPERARVELCDPNDAPSASASRSAARNRGAGGNAGGPGAAAPPVAPDGDLPDQVLEDVLDLPQSSLEDLNDQLDDATGAGGLGGAAGGTSGAAPGTDAAAQDLLDFLFQD